MSNFFHIGTILVNDSGVYAKNYTWLQILIERELDCKTIVFLIIGTSFLLLGGLPTDLINKSRAHRDFIQTPDVFIANRAVNVMHEAENLTNYRTQSSDFPDPQNILAVRQFHSNKRLFGKDYDCKTDVFFRPSLVPNFEKSMQDTQVMSYMVELQMWI